MLILILIFTSNHKFHFSGELTAIKRQKFVLNFSNNLNRCIHKFQSQKARKERKQKRNEMECEASQAGKHEAEDEITEENFLSLPKKL